MTEISSNLEYMFNEAGETIESRIEAASKCGIKLVEIFSTDGRDVGAIATALEKHGVTLYSMVVDPRIMLVLKDTHEKFLETFRATAEVAKTLGCKHLVCGSGVGAPFLKRAIALDIVSEAIDQAADIAAEYDITILLEAVNARVDHPGVFFSNTSDTVYIAKKLNRDNVKVLYDLYHSIAEGEDIDQSIASAAPVMAHVQIADFPGRGEPGAGDQDWPALLKKIADCGYGGPIGVECYPTQDTEQALSYIKSLL